MKIAYVFLAFIFALSCKSKPEQADNLKIEASDSVFEVVDTISIEEEKSDTLFNEVVDISGLDKYLTGLLPKGYEVHDVLKGDLNKDSLEDYVFLVGSTNPEKFEEFRPGVTADRNRQGIVIIFGERNNKYKKIVENLSCFPSNFEDGGVYYAPELYLDINKKNNLEINYAHGRYGNWGFIFRYQNGRFELIGSFTNSNRGPIGLSSVSINYSTKKKRIMTNINVDTEQEEDEVWEEKWEDIKVDKLLDLNEVEDLVFDEQLNYN